MDNSFLDLQQKLMAFTPSSKMLEIQNRINRVYGNPLYQHHGLSQALQTKSFFTNKIPNMATTHIPTWEGITTISEIVRPFLAHEHQWQESLKGISAIADSLMGINTIADSLAGISAVADSLINVSNAYNHSHMSSAWDTFTKSAQNISAYATMIDPEVYIVKTWKRKCIKWKTDKKIIQTLTFAIIP